jgi:SAM-dependent methyltransferase
MKPFSRASESNRQPIIEVLLESFSDQQKVLEIGSGTGQHAVYFSRYLTHLIWQTSDRQINHNGINQWIDEFSVKNIRRPLVLDVENKDNWNHLLTLQNKNPVDGVFTANTLHIMPWSSVEKMFAGVAKLFSINRDSCSNPRGRFIVYGPFNRDGEFTSTGNAVFNQQLQQSDSSMGIRNDRDVVELAGKNFLQLVGDIDMPANNRMLIFDVE